MPASPPEALTRLLGAQDEDVRTSAWEELVAEHSRLIHSVARRSASDYDGAMERYSFVLEKLREQEFKRLRGFDANGSSKFSTWLVVVASRLCVDWHRKSYGRAKPGETDDEVGVRRRLADLVAERVGLDHIADGSGPSAESRVRRRELDDALEEALVTLSSADRLLLRLRFEDQRPMTEIARTLGLSSEFAAYRTLKRTLAQLRAELESRGVDGPNP